MGNLLPVFLREKVPGGGQYDSVSQWNTCLVVMDQIPQYIHIASV